MKIEYITTTEEMILNPRGAWIERKVRLVVRFIARFLPLETWAGPWRQARIEVFTDQPGQHYPEEVGQILTWCDEELFSLVRDALEGDR